MPIKAACIYLKLTFLKKKKKKVPKITQASTPQNMDPPCLRVLYCLPSLHVYITSSSSIGTPKAKKSKVTCLGSQEGKCRNWKLEICLTTKPVNFFYHQCFPNQNGMEPTCIYTMPQSLSCCHTHTYTHTTNPPISTHPQQEPPLPHLTATTQVNEFIPVEVTPTTKPQNFDLFLKNF